MSLLYLWYIFIIMNFKDAILFFFLLFGLTSLGAASDNNTAHKAKVSIPDVALLALQFEENPHVDFVGKATMAGDKISLQNRQKSGVWLNYSSIAKDNQRRKITAVVVGTIPEGMAVTVKADNSVGAGAGDLGRSNGIIRLSESPSDVISGIGSCYTGSGVQNGHLLWYDVEIDEDRFYDEQIEEETILSVVYTLTDDN